MPDTETNTAGRLRKILFGHKRENTPCGIIWARVFRLKSAAKQLSALNDNELIEIRERLTTLYGEVKRLEDEVHLFCEGGKANPAILLRNIPRIKKALIDVPLVESWQDVRANYLTDATYTTLEILETQLPSEGVIDNDELARFSQQVDELVTFIRNSSLPSPLRGWILSLLNSIRRSLDTYEVSGAKGFHEALTSILGELYINADELKRSPEGTTLMEKFLPFMNTLGAFAERYARWRPFLADTVMLASTPAVQAIFGNLFGR